MMREARQCCLTLSSLPLPPWPTGQNIPHLSQLFHQIKNKRPSTFLLFRLLHGEYTFLTISLLLSSIGSTSLARAAAWRGTLARHSAKRILRMVSTLLPLLSSLQIVIEGGRRQEQGGGHPQASGDAQHSGGGCGGNCKGEVEKIGTSGQEGRLSAINFSIEIIKRGQI